MATNREWLYSLDVADLAEWFDSEHVEDAISDYLGKSQDSEILSQDSDMDNDGLPPENDVSAEDVDANDANAAQDTREKLEADVLKYYTHTVSTAMWPPSANKHTYMVSVSMDDVLGWLDRQAAISERECCKYIDGAGCDGPEVVHRLNDRIAEMQERVDTLTRYIHEIKQIARKV